MNTKLKYLAPKVKDSARMELEQGILTGSVVDPKTTIETAGQKVEERDFSQSGFNTTWE